MLKPLVVIVGPTAVGKSEVGIKVAQSIGGEIISGDSMQVYRGMDIGTAKVTPVEMQGIPHHMIDIMEPHEEFSVALFKETVSLLNGSCSANLRKALIALDLILGCRNMGSK